MVRVLTASPNNIDTYEHMYFSQAEIDGLFWALSQNNLFLKIHPLLHNIGVIA